MSGITLHCLVSGDGADKIFPVDIASNDNVSILKDMIKEELAVLFKHIGAKDMQLFKVSLPAADAEQARDPGKIEGAEQLSSPIHEISEVFQVLDERHIHVIVVKPTVSLNCYYPATKPTTFTIAIRKDARINVLLEMIGQRLKDWGYNVPLTEIHVYKTDIPLYPKHSAADRARQFLHEHPGDPIEMDSTVDKISDIFPLSSYGDKRLDILLATPEIVETLDTLGDPDAVYNRKVKKALLNYLSPPHSGPSPSEVVRSAEKVATFLQSRSVCMDRVPVAMFSPPLAKLQRNLDNLETLVPSCSDINHAAAFLGGAVQLCTTKQERQQNTEPHVDKLLGENGEWQETLEWAGNIKPDAIWWHNDFALLILELKNILGNDGDAVLHATVDYSKILMGEKFKDLWGTCNFPVILLGISGKRIEVSAAVCAGPIYVSNLYRLDLALGFHASATLTQLARVFKALSSARTDLIIHYDKITASSSAGLRLTAIYPNPTFVDGRPPPLTFSKFTTRTGQSSLTLPNLGDAFSFIYNATLDSTGEEVVVKFTPRYNQAAHTILSNLGLAPKLHFCGRIVGDLYMVVMDRVNGKSLWHLLQEGTAIPAFVLEKVEEAISYLHDANMVFGDLRDANILYCLASDGGVFLVDFDWAGKDGQDLYPATLNTESRLEESVRPLGVMRKAHDIWQVDRLKHQCARNSYVFI
ncbi:hypothetical protein FA15DRAFT_648623 [Coprinopsis marcescibilis]|uniref:Crinkler effector protein N-terminal domain-containing protein n=1 Tax=Coprinopsis marcescibilis TaxID=230819 RepID=A0A5C3KGX4_COPMA|nr:hypothetical protein FA15DRAFT_648623 [Coprinopsis marcescibilis]